MKQRPATHPAPKPAAAKPAKAAARAIGGEINALLDQARLDVRHDRLTTPLDNNAHLYYTRVLALDPSNASAKQGIRHIAGKYLEWAIDDANAGNYHRAGYFLGKASAVDPNHPNIAAVRRLIREHRHSIKMNFYLAKPGLDHRTSRMVKQLHDIGRTVAKKHATVVITARSDSEGQWIYQQLNAATPDRVRARLDIGDKPRIRLIY